MQIKYTIYAYENVRGDSGLTKFYENYEKKNSGLTKKQCMEGIGTNDLVKNFFAD